MSAELALWADADYKSGLPTVNSDNLHWYLMQKQEFYQGVNFAKEINLGGFDGVLCAFYRRVDEEARSVGSKVELNQVLYYDPRTKKPAFSHYRVGGGDQVTTPAVDIALLGGLPLIDIHNHNRDSLPSDADYRRMIGAYIGSRFVICPSIIVLCPTYQLLALADPVLSPRQSIYYDFDVFTEYPFKNNRRFHHLSLERYVNPKVQNDFEEWMDNVQRGYNYRTINAVMYFSRDCRHFTRFSA